EEIKKILENLINISKELNLYLEEEDFEETLDSHSQELPNDSLMEMEALQIGEQKEEEEKL
ncbi:hypothetical protein SK128_000490, partial [Halocaridina rubra]